MKFLLDMPMPHRTAVWLSAQGQDAVHARDLGLAKATDADILRRAQREGRVVLTMDLDFPRLLSAMSAEGPSVILIRLRHPTAKAIQERLEALFELGAELTLSGAIVVLEEHRIRLHRFPPL